MLKKAFNLKNLFTFSCIFFIILMTGFFIFSLNSALKRSNIQRIDDAKKVKSIIEDEVLRFVYGLQGAKGVILTTDLKASPKKFKEYAESREYFINFPGALGFGFIRYVPKEKIVEYSKRHSPYFKIHPDSNKNEYMIIELVEPLSLNMKALGLDISFEANRKSAATQSAKSGKAVLTKRITLVQSKIEKSGFLYLLPIYDTIATPSNEDERMKHLVGWSYAPIDFSALMDNIRQKIPPRMKIQISFENDEKPLTVSQTNEKNLFLNGATQAAIDAGGTKWDVYTVTNLRKIELEMIFIVIIYFIIVMLFNLGAYYIFNVFINKDNLLVEKTVWIDAILKSANHSIISTDPDGKILTFNYAAEKLLGYSADEIINIHNPGLFHDPNEIINRAKILTAELGVNIEPGFRTFVSKAEIYGSDTTEWTYIKKNGQRVAVSLCVTAIYNTENHIIGYLGIAEDLTKENELMNLIDLQQAQMIERSKMTLLGEMAGGIAHEINTPLAIILTISNQLARDEENSKALNKLTMIKETAERISKIVKGLKLYSRNSENDSKELINLASLVDLSVDLCNQKLLNSQVNLSINIDKNINFLGKSTEISQVLLNLIGNSIDAIESTEERWIKINAMILEKTIVLSITDSGHGIPTIVAEKMMNPFFTTKEVGKGTGLGLSISKGIIEMHNGKFIYDKECENTKFIIELPLAEVG